jgi:hypothetical protein
MEKATMRGQGATEYLVLLAVVLIVALVALALLGGNAGTSTDAMITQSMSYWAGVPAPFHVTASKVWNSGTEFALENGAGDKMTIRSVKVNGQTKSIIAPGSNLVFSPGQEKVVQITGLNLGCTEGKAVAFDLQFTYTDEFGVNHEEYGEKKFMAKCVDGGSTGVCIGAGGTCFVDSCCGGLTCMGDYTCGIDGAGGLADPCSDDSDCSYIGLGLQCSPFIMGGGCGYAHHVGMACNPDFDNCDANTGVICYAGTRTCLSPEGGGCLQNEHCISNNCDVGNAICIP